MNHDEKYFFNFLDKKAFNAVPGRMPQVDRVFQVLNVMYNVPKYITGKITLPEASVSFRRVWRNL
jgi:hypothetical protein